MKKFFNSTSETLCFQLSVMRALQFSGVGLCFVTLYTPMLLRRLLILYAKITSIQGRLIPHSPFAFLEGCQKNMAKEWLSFQELISGICYPVIYRVLPSCAHSRKKLKSSTLVNIRYDTSQLQQNQLRKFNLHHGSVCFTPFVLPCFAFKNMSYNGFSKKNLSLFYF